MSSSLDSKELFERAFADVNEALAHDDLSQALFPMTGEEARAYLRGKQSTLLWVLEMMG